MKLVTAAMNHSIIRKRVKERENELEFNVNDDEDSQLTKLNVTLLCSNTRSVFV